MIRYTLGMYLWVLLLLFACNTKEPKLSASYLELKQYLTTANISDPQHIYFYAGKPRMPLPNVYCFDSNGVQLNAPPQCFSVIKEYILFLGDSIIPAKKNGESLNKFLDSIHILDAYDKTVRKADLKSLYDYYLFVDYIAIPDPAFQKILYDAVKSSKESKKKIKLFLVHAISQKNKKYFASPPKIDTVNAQAIRDSLLR